MSRSFLVSVSSSVKWANPLLLCVLPCACLCSEEKVYTLPSGLHHQPTMSLLPKHLGCIHGRAQGRKTRAGMGSGGSPHRDTA